jgi:hypothetical protein
MHNVDKSLMPQIFLYLRRQIRLNPIFTPFMFSVARLRLIAVSLFALPLVRSHEDVLCMFFSSFNDEFSPRLLMPSSYFLCILLRSTGEFTRPTVRYCLLSFKPFCGFQHLRRIGRMYSLSGSYISILIYFNSKQTSMFLQTFS